MMMQLAGTPVCNLQRGPALLDMVWEEGACVLPVLRQKGGNRTSKNVFPLNGDIKHCLSVYGVD